MSGLRLCLALCWLGICFTFNAQAQYNGGFHGGIKFGERLHSACSPSTQTNVYLGGQADGYAKGLINQQLCGSVFINVSYFGGAADGYARDIITQQSCPAEFTNVNYFGSQGDGYHTAVIDQSPCTTPPFAGFNYQGGFGDGYARDTLTQQLCPALFVNVNFFGGAQDGFSKGDLPQNACAPLFFGYNFFGGNGDGYARDTLTQQLCPALFVNVNYFGGAQDGFASSTLPQSVCPPLLTGTNYFGGNNDGFVASTILQTNCPDLLYYYRSRINGNWNTLSVWEFSTDPNYINPAPAFAVTPPAHNNSYEIVVRSPNTVSINTPIIADDLKINTGGTLSLLSGGSLTLNNGTAATDLTIDGTLSIGSTATLPAGAAVINNGIWNTTVNTLSSASTINHNNGAIYNHAFDGGSVPTSIWNIGSTLQISGLVNATSIAGLNQSFHHIEYNSFGQLTPFVNLSGAITAINGNLTITSTGNNTREVCLFNNATNTNTALTVAGNVFVNSGKLAITGGAASGAANPVLTINGNLTVNGTAILDMTGNAATTAAGSNIDLLGNLSINASATLTRSQNTPSVFRFNKASGIQTYTASAPTTAISSGNINFQVGNGTNTPELVTANDFVMNGSASLTVNTGATIDAATRIIRGATAGVNGSFALNSGAVLKTANINGIDAPLSGTTGSVQTGTVRNFSGSATYIYNGSANQITGTGLPLNLVSPGQLTIANTGAAGSDIVTLTNNTTTTPLLNLQTGRFAIGTGNTLNISNNGNIVATAGDFATGITGGTLNSLGSATFTGNSNPYNVYTSGGIDYGVGTVTIQSGGAFRINAGGAVINNGPFYASNSTLEYNSGGIFERGLEWNAASGRGYPHHVSVLNATLNPAKGNSSYAAIPLNTAGNVNINAGSSISMNFSGNNMIVPLIIDGDLTLSGNLSCSQSAGGNIDLKGNWINDGAGINFTPNGRAVNFNGNLNQNLGGSNLTINTFYDLAVNNLVGLTLTGANVQVNNQMSLVSGKINLNSRTFTLGVPGFNGILAGGGPTAYFNSGNTSSKFVRYTTIAGNSYIFPVGAGISYSPVSVNLYVNNTLNNSSNIAVHVVNGAHPNLGTSNTYINRYWGVEPSGFPSSSISYGINYTYNDADVVGVEANLKPYKYNNAGWIAAVGSGANFEMGIGTVNPGTNTVTWEGLYSFSDFTSIGNGTPLPISLVDFNARPLFNDVELTWTTVSETNNDFFTIERAKDGVSFAPISTVDGAGNSNTQLYYKTMDEEPLEGISYYRLKQTDFDGRFEYSDIKVVNFLKPGSISEWAIYPNPTNLQGIHILADNLMNETITIRLTDIVGNLVLEKNMAVGGKRLNSFIEFGEIAAGVYNLAIIDGKEMRNFKVVMTGRQ
jgi:hypothetical protein